MFYDLMSRITDLFDLLLRLDFSRKVLSTFERPFSMRLFFWAALRSLSFIPKIYSSLGVLFFMLLKAYSFFLCVYLRVVR